MESHSILLIFLKRDYLRLNAEMQSMNNVIKTKNIGFPVSCIVAEAVWMSLETFWANTSISSSS